MAAQTGSIFVLPGSPYTMEFYENKYKCNRNRKATPRRVKPATARNARKSIAHQIDYATQRYHEAVMTYMYEEASPRMYEEVWAWETFSQQVLPCLKFLDD